MLKVNDRDYRRKAFKKLYFHCGSLKKRNLGTKFFPSFYREIIFCWKNHLTMMTEIPPCILSQYLCCNANIQVDNTSIQFSRFSEKNINRVSQFFKNNGSIKKWHEFKREYDLHQNSYFQLVQLIDFIPEKWKSTIKKTMKLVITLDKLTSAEIYSILILKVQKKPSSNIFLEILFNHDDIDWTAIYMLPRLVTHNTYMSSSQLQFQS